MGTLHRDAVEQGLADMQARYAAMAEPTHPALRAERELTLALTAAAMRSLGEHRDRGIHDRDFGGGFTGALGNVIASISETLTGGHPTAALMIAGTFVNGATAQAVRRITDQSPESFNQVMVELPVPEVR